MTWAWSDIQEISLEDVSGLQATCKSWFDFYNINFKAKKTQFQLDLFLSI